MQLIPDSYAFLEKYFELVWFALVWSGPVWTGLIKIHVKPAQILRTVEAVHTRYHRERHTKLGNDTNNPQCQRPTTFTEVVKHCIYSSDTPTTRDNVQHSPPTILTPLRSYAPRFTTQLNSIQPSSIHLSSCADPFYSCTASHCTALHHTLAPIPS
jgi:hypothetical protein